MAWLLIHTVYRVEKSGVENVPEEGPAVIVCNHVSFVDALVIMASCPRPIRFVMIDTIYRIPGLNLIFRAVGAIPISPKPMQLLPSFAMFETISLPFLAGGCHVSHLLTFLHPRHE